MRIRKTSLQVPENLQRIALHELLSNFRQSSLEMLALVAEFVMQVYTNKPVDLLAVCCHLFSITFSFF